MGLGGRSARRHQTASAHKNAVVSEDFWDFHPQQSVMTIDGIGGVVAAVQDGPYPGTEVYDVVLDNGLGGGQYTASQLSARGDVTASVEHTAIEDYPELGTILSDRPDPAKQRFAAKAGGNPFEFRHEETNTGGMKFPRQVDMTAHHPETGEQAGHVRYFPPKRRGGPISIDQVKGDVPGAASALMNEVEGRHPGSSTKFLHQVKRNNNNPDVTGHAHERAGGATDWDTHYPNLSPTIHRGFSLRLPDWSPHTFNASANTVNSSETTKEQHLHELHSALPQGPAIGTHWTEDEHAARLFAHNAVSDHRTDIPVVLHASTPARKDLETRHDHLYRGGVFPYGDEHSPENEVPVRKGRKVAVTGISWRPDAPHPDADEHGWMHHTYDEAQHHTAAKVVPSQERAEADAEDHDEEDPEFIDPSLGGEHDDAADPTGESTPSSCSYCGGTDFTDLTDNGRNAQASCATCGGTMSSWGGQWTPELIGDPSNHPQGDADPASGGASGAAGAVDPLVRDQSRRGSKHQYRQTVQTANGYEDQNREIEGPLYHGGRAKVGPGDHITTGRKPNPWGDEGPKSTHNYFSADQDTALSYAHQLGGKGRLYEVEPTGEFKKDYGPHDYKTPHPLRVVREVHRDEWPDWSKQGARTADRYHRTSPTGWQYDTAIKGQIKTTSPEGNEETHHQYSIGTGITQSRHHEDMPTPMYHGTPHELEGNQIEPGRPGNFVKRMKHTYMTEDPNEARNYARTTGKVYEVKPTTWYGHRSDAKGTAWASEGPLDVVREVSHHEAPGYDDLTGGLRQSKLAMWGDDDDEHEHNEDCAEYGCQHEQEEPRQNWDHILDGVHEIHRGLGAHLHPAIHRIVHDESRPVHERAHLLLKEIAKGDPQGRNSWSSKALGTHWTSDHGVAQDFAERHNSAELAIGKNRQQMYHEKNHEWGTDDEGMPKAQPGTAVVIHAHPTRSSIDENPNPMTHGSGDIYDHDSHGEREVPYHPGASVEVKGISWKKIHDEDPIEDEPYTRHDFSETQHHTAKNGKTVSWDEIGDHYPEQYGDPDLHGSYARGSDAHGPEAHRLAFSRPDDPEGDHHGLGELRFHTEHVDPKHIDHATPETMPHEFNDPHDLVNNKGRIDHAYQGYKHNPNAVPPVVLVHRHGIFHVVDGHHRSIAAKKAGVPVRAFVAHSPYPNEPIPGIEDDPDQYGPLHGAEPHPGFQHLEKQAATDGPDWCAHRRAERCFYPGDNKTELNILHVPQDRGPCPWDTSWQQQVCPISEPGPMALMRAKGSKEAVFGDQRAHESELPDEIHRGIPMRLPEDKHTIAHDESRPPEERAQAIMDHYHFSHERNQSKPNLGRHWTTKPGTAQGFATSRMQNDPEAVHPLLGRHDPRMTQVIFHAQTPAPSRIIRGERTMKDQEIFGHDHGEAEVPVKGNSVMHLNGISFGNGGDLTRHDFPEPLRMKASKTASDEDDYRLQHEAPDADYGAPLHDVRKHMRDFYEHPEYFHGGLAHDHESTHVIRAARDQPEKMIHVYRSLPAEHAHKGIRPGDWVSTSQDYARGEGRTTSNTKDDYPVIRARVPAKHLHTEGDVNEWGFNGPETVFGSVAFKGGHHEEIADRADGSVSKVVRKPKKNGSLDVTSLLRMSKKDSEFGFEITAAWKDVREKAKRIRARGGVVIKSASNQGVAGTVQGDNADYDSMLVYVPGTHKLADWTCQCAWAQHAWDRQTYYGRQCSHSLALQYEAQSRGMFGKTVKVGSVQEDSRPVSLVVQSLVERDEDPADVMKILMAFGLQHSSAKEVFNLATGRTAAEDHPTLYRGIHMGLLHPDEVHEMHANPSAYFSKHTDNEVGSHWTPDINVAHGFALGDDGRYDNPDPDDEESYHHPAGLILHSKVHPKHILDPDSDEGQDFKDFTGAFDQNHPEQERSVRPGAPVHISHVSAVSYDPISNDHRDTTVEHGMHHTAASTHMCPQCGHEVALTAHTCARCGARLTPLDDLPELHQASLQVEAEEHKCPHCGARIGPIAEEHHKCPKCGAPIGKVGSLNFTELQFVADDHHTNDTRRNAPEEGHNPPSWGLPMLGCPQCGTGGCGHCGGSGQVVQAPAWSPSTTMDPIADESGDAGPMIRGGITEVSSLHTAAMVTCGECEGDGYIEHEIESDDDEDLPLGHQLPVRRETCDVCQGRGITNDEIGIAQTEEHQRQKASALAEHLANPGAPHGVGCPVACPVQQAMPLAERQRVRREHAQRQAAKAKPEGPFVSGVALKAADTGRILMLQRGMDDEKDPARGTWELPGGHHEDGDVTSLHAAIREWQEEVGQPFPEGGTVHHTWTSPNGVYQGHVVVIPSEKDLSMKDGRVIPNPDDPKGDNHEQAAWWDVDHARKNPALRPELKTGTPWNEIAKAGGGKTAAAWDSLSSIDPEPGRGVSVPDHSNSPNPASTGFATSQDPASWNELGTRQNDLVPSNYIDASLHSMLHDEPEGALPSTDGDLDDGDVPNLYQVPDTQPEIPGVDGSMTPNSFHASGGVSDIVAKFQATAAASSLMNGAGKGDPNSGGDMSFDIAAAARAHLAGTGTQKTALKDFGFAEQQALINEGARDKVRARNLDDLQIDGTHYAHLDAVRGMSELDPEDIFS